MKRLLIVGCGFVGMQVAKQWQASECGLVYALTRSAERSGTLNEAGIEAIVGNWNDVSTLDSLPSCDAVLVSIPHREDGGHGVQTHVQGLKNLLPRMPLAVSKLIYLSTTGVYGDSHEEVDELTPTQPTRIGPQIAVAAEEWLMANYSAPRLAIIRLAGIYGPGRIPLAEKLRQGEPLQVPQAGWLNLAHVEDIASMLLEVNRRDLSRALYVFSDAHPVQRMEFYRTLAKMCGVDEPQFALPDANNSRTQRAGAKRVNPHRLINELSLKLRFASYREGLADCLKSDSQKD